MNNSTDIAIVIPIYRDFLDKYEQESINSIIRNFNDFEIVFDSNTASMLSSASHQFLAFNLTQLKYEMVKCADLNVDHRIVIREE